MNPLVVRIRALWERRPLAVIMACAVIVRVLAALFSKGYGMHDDHFFAIEVAQRWVDGHRDWLGDPASLHGLLYPGLHYLLFAGLEKLGVSDPQLKMYVVRFLHAAYSLTTVYLGYKTVLLLADERKARLAGALLAVFWIAPFMAVRNLVEVVCQPPLVAAFYLLCKGRELRSTRLPLLAGLLFGLAFAIRFQTAVIAGTAGLVLLVLGRWAAAVAVGIGFALSALVVQGGTDWIGYGRPFSSVLAYLEYNSDPRNVYAYTVGPWHRYLGLLAGVLIPPASLLLLFGFARTWRRHALLFWPTLAFLVIHSIYPNKQERFLLPVLPFILMLSVIGWEEFAETSRFWARHGRLSRWLWGWFWGVNVLLLLVYSTTYSKKARVETLSFLGAQPDLRGIVLESHEAAVTFPPLFYLGRAVPVYQLPSVKSVESLRAEIAASGQPDPNYVVFMGQKDIDRRLERASQLFPNLAHERQVVPSLVDRVAHFFNPRHNVNLTCDVYRVGTTTAAP